MTDLIPAPSLDTWYSGELVTADWLNRNVRDVQKFLAYAPLTIVNRATTQSLANNTIVTITFDTEVIDVDGMFTAPSTNLTAQRPGVYAIQFQPHFATNSTDVRSGQINVNGVMVASNGNVSGNGSDTLLNCSAVVALNTGDVITATEWQDSGGALNCGNAAYGAPRLSVRLISTANVPIDYTDPSNPVVGPPAPPPSGGGGGTPTKHTSTFAATWSRSYDGDLSTTWDDSKLCYQGGDNANTYRGNTRSLVGFNNSSIKNTLSGATNISATFTFKVLHTWYSSGAPILPTYHNYTAKPTSWAQSHVWGMGSAGTRKAGQSVVCNVSADAVDGFSTGRITGMGFGPAPSTSLTYYAYIAGALQSPAPYLTFTYWK